MLRSLVGSEMCIRDRVRRDAKSSLEQREQTISCGHDAMISIPIVGKAIRLWSSDFYALCSFCGCFMKLTPNNKFETELCCLRCDHEMLNRNKQLSLVNDKSVAPTCRFCGKVHSPALPLYTITLTSHHCFIVQADPRRSGARWKLVKSPLDTSGRNASLPPPLRFVHFCPAHFRTWIPTCMKTMRTRVILSHIVYGAKPCYEQKHDVVEDDEEVVVKKKTKKRKRMPKK